MQTADHASIQVIFIYKQPVLSATERAIMRSWGRFDKRLLELHFDAIEIDTGGSLDRFYNRLLGSIDFDTGGNLGRLLERLLIRPRVNDAAKL